MRNIFVFLFLAVYLGVSAQNNNYTAYINQPIGLASKVRLSIEKDINKNYSLLLNYTNFYGLVGGEQSYLELRRNYRKPNKSDFFVYSKMGAGNSFQTNTVYGIFGIGVGEKIYFDKGQRFSLVCVQGIKVCPNIIGNEDPDTASGGLRGLFYVIGPGSLIDLHFNFGFRLK
jgi:hypothetical protein